MSFPAEANNEREEKAEMNYSKLNLSYQSFQRSFTLSKNVVDPDKSDAKYQDDVLKLSIPTREKAKEKPPRMIEVP